MMFFQELDCFIVHTLIVQQPLFFNPTWQQLASTLMILARKSVVDLKAHIYDPTRWRAHHAHKFARPHISHVVRIFTRPQVCTRLYVQLNQRPRTFTEQHDTITRSFWQICFDSFVLIRLTRSSRTTCFETPVLTRSFWQARLCALVLTRSFWHGRPATFVLTR